LKTVVLPAPFGPMIAVIARSRAVKQMSSTATRPPNRMVRCSTSSSGFAIVGAPKVIGDPVPAR
jgi:hypothetical protein